jgi:hypothetical protein
MEICLIDGGKRKKLLKNGAMPPSGYGSRFEASAFGTIDY